MAKQLFGAFDYWVEHAFDLLEPESPPEAPARRWSQYARQQAYFRERLAGLSPEQKQAIRHLMREMAHGMLFSILVTLDQGDYGDFRLALQPKNALDVTEPIPITSAEVPDLHDDLNDWTLSFSRFADEILDLVETKHGWQFQLKDFASP